MERITEKQLQSLIDHLNKITNSPATPYAKDETGKYTAQVGNYHLDCAYGGYNLARMCSAGGGISHPITSGYMTKRELYNLIHAYIRGISYQS